MRQRFVTVACSALLVVVLTPGAAFNQEYRNICVQGFLGASKPSEEKMGSALWSNIGFCVAVLEKIYLSFEFGHWRSAVTESHENLYEGTLYVNPFLLSVQYRLMPEKAVNPYVFLGGGYIFSRFRMGDIITIPEISISQKTKNGAGVKAGFGLEVDLSRSLSVAGEVSYLYSKVEARTTIQDMNFGSSVDHFKVNLSALIIQIGFRYTLH